MKGVAAVIHALGTSERSVCLEAISTLGGLGADGGPAVAPLTNHARESAGFERKCTLKALVRLAADLPAGEAAIIALLADEHGGIRGATAEAVGRYGPYSEPIARALLATALGDWYAREEAVAAQVIGWEGEDAAGGFEVPDWAKMGPEQETLKKSAGEWKVNRKMWMAPGQPPMEVNETATGRMLYDGRYLEVDYNGEMMGTPFKGRLLMGFDRVDKEYVAIWIDSMSTYISVSRGPEKDGKITFHQNDPDWMTGMKRPTTMELQWKSDDVYTLAFSEPGPDGNPRTSMLFTYARQTETE